MTYYTRSDLRLFAIACALVALLTFVGVSRMPKPPELICQREERGEVIAYAPNAQRRPDFPVVDCPTN